MSHTAQCEPDEYLDSLGHCEACHVICPEHGSNSWISCASKCPEFYGRSWSSTELPTSTLGNHSGAPTSKLEHKINLVIGVCIAMVPMIVIIVIVSYRSHYYGSRKRRTSHNTSPVASSGGDAENEHLVLPEVQFVEHEPDKVNSGTSEKLVTKADVYFVMSEDKETNSPDTDKQKFDGRRSTDSSPSRPDSELLSNNNITECRRQSSDKFSSQGPDLPLQDGVDCAAKTEQTVVNVSDPTSIHV